MRVIIAGGTGVIGRRLANDMARDGHEVIVLSRSPKLVEGLSAAVRVEGWDARTSGGWGALADGAGAIVNLAGANLAGDGFLPTRWTDERKRLLVESRVNAGRAVVAAVAQAAKKPAVIIQASAVGYYGPRANSDDVAEGAPPGDDFPARLCVDWEASTQPVEALGVRRAVIRSGVVLSFRGGALQRMALPFSLFVGGPFGSGQQPFPWIHPADEIGAIRFLIHRAEASGAFNLTAPHLLTNAEFSRALGRAMSRPSLLPVPGFAFKTAFGEVASILLTGQRAVPARLLELGYEFQFPEVNAALADLYRAEMARGARTAG